MLAELYETKVPQETRGYIDSKIAPPRPKRPSRPAPKQKPNAPASQQTERKETNHEQ